MLLKLMQDGWGSLLVLPETFCALLLGFFSDIFKRRMKLSVISFYTLGLLAFLVFVCVYLKLIPYSQELLWTSYVLNTVGVWAPSPLFFELAAEINYPVSEALSNGFITWLINVVGCIFLFIMMIPAIGTGWINWSMTGSLIIAIPYHVFLRGGLFQIRY